MQKRLLLALVLSICFTTLWSLLMNSMGYNHRPAPVEPATVEETLEETAETSAPVPEPGSDTATVEPAAPADATTAEPEPPAPVIEPRTDVLENAQIRLEFDNKGGVIRDAVLKNFHQSVDGKDPIRLIFSSKFWPGTLVFDDKQTDGGWLYEVQDGDDRLVYTGTFNGLKVRKSFHLEKGFLLHADVAVEGGPSQNFYFVVGEGLQPLGPGEKVTASFWDMGAVHPKMMSFAWSENDAHKSAMVDKGNRDGFDPKLKEDASIDWLGIKDNYFASVFLPDKPVANLYTRITDVRPGESLIPLPVVALRAEGGVSGKFFMGPMIEEQLLAADPRLDDLITYGWAGVLSKLLFKGLKLAHSLTGNWGWAIVLLTIFIRSLMIPLTIPQVKSSLKMRKIQPDIEKLKAKFPGQDLESKQKLSQETFALYKKEGINPFSSCVTALLQMPVFFAYFSLLRSSISLRQAEWVLWIHDLSVNDALFILPIVMGATMFLSTMAMPMPGGDPLQQKMMKFMPVIFSMMFVFMPAGLILYMITSNLFTLGQTKFLQWRYRRLAE